MAYTRYVYQTKIPKRVLRTCVASRRNERGLGINERDCTAVPVTMEVRSRQDAKSVRIKRRHGAMSAGEVLEEESFVCYLKAESLIGLRGHGRGGKRKRGERFLVAAALSKIGAGVALLVRKVGVALLLCFYSGRRDMCVCCLCFASAFTLSKSDASPHYIISGVSLP